jgi:hypothetical protein
MRLAAKDLLFILDDASPAVLFIHVDCSLSTGDRGGTTPRLVSELRRRR